MPRHNRYDDTGMFRELRSGEETEFRIWAHDHSEDARYRLETDTLCLVHPVVRDEWRRMGLIPAQEDQS